MHLPTWLAGNVAQNFGMLAAVLPNQAYDMVSIPTQLSRKPRQT
jgi:hypothetical protein